MLNHNNVLCFDFDGTLIDSSTDIAHAVSEVRQGEGLDRITPETVTEAIGTGVRDTIESLFPDRIDLTDRHISEFRRAYRKNCAANVKPYENIPELLDSLREIELALVTNKPLAMTTKILEKLDWTDQFEIVLGPDSCKAKKPSPEPLLTVADRLNVDSEDLIMVGDTWADIRAGNELNARSVACLYGFGDSSLLLDEGPDENVETVNQLWQLLQQD